MVREANKFQVARMSSISSALAPKSFEPCNLNFFGPFNQGNLEFQTNSTTPNYPGRAKPILVVTLVEDIVCSNEEHHRRSL